MALRIRTYTLSIKNMPPIAAGLLVIGIGVLLVALGLTLIAGLAVVGALTVAGVVGYRIVRRSVRGVIGRRDATTPAGELDPANEVFPPSKQIGSTADDKRK